MNVTINKVPTGYVWNCHNGMHWNDPASKFVTGGTECTLQGVGDRYRHAFGGRGILGLTDKMQSYTHWTAGEYKLRLKIKDNQKCVNSKISVVKEINLEGSD